MSAALPLELQDNILTLATRDSRHAARNLRVSRRTHRWLEKLMYKNIVLCGETEVKRFLECLHLRPMHVEFAQQYIKSLFLVGSVLKSTVIDILSICDHVTCLALVLSTDEFALDVSSLWRALDALPLKSLLFAVKIDLASSLSTSPPAFQHLTHLDVNDDFILNQPNSGLEGLATLTHLCAVLKTRADPVAVMRLINNTRLQLLAFRVEVQHIVIQRFLENHGLLDRRIVLMPIEMTNWSLLGQGEMLVWELAGEQLKLPIPKDIGHRCLSLTSIQNAYADYNDIDMGSERNMPCNVSRARTKGPHRD